MESSADGQPEKFLPDLSSSDEDSDAHDDEDDPYQRPMTSAAADALERQLCGISLKP